MINGTSTAVSPGSDIEVERASELAFEFAEMAACLISEMGSMVHDRRDAV